MNQNQFSFNRHCKERDLKSEYTGGVYKVSKHTDFKDLESIFIFAIVLEGVLNKSNKQLYTKCVLRFSNITDFYGVSLNGQKTKYYVIAMAFKIWNLNVFLKIFLFILYEIYERINSFWNSPTNISYYTIWT